MLKFELFYAWKDDTFLVPAIFDKNPSATFAAECVQFERPTSAYRLYHRRFRLGVINAASFSPLCQNFGNKGLKTLRSHFASLFFW